MQKIIVAVSGGVDSVVLLDLLWKKLSIKYGEKQAREKIIVAHFEHGIRGDSLEDLYFVRDLAKKYGLKFEYTRGFLGENCSELRAREARYIFLRDIAQKNKANIFTAHHLDDLVETIAINIQRGTGWRGLACLNSPDIERVLLDIDKQQIIKYAQQHNLVWQEDYTNKMGKYLRNRLRNQLNNSQINKMQLAQLRQNQIKLSKDIDNQINQLKPFFTSNNKFSRYFFSQIDQTVAIEILKTLALDEIGQVLLYSQLEDWWIKVKTVQSGRKINLIKGVNIRFSTNEFWFEKD